MNNSSTATAADSARIAAITVMLFLHLLATILAVYFSPSQLIPVVPSEPYPLPQHIGPSLPSPPRSSRRLLLTVPRRASTRRPRLPVRRSHLCV
jgi:hypothetical protein